MGDGQVEAVECIRLELGEPDDSGRARPVPVPGSEFLVPCDSVVIAIGFGVNPTVSRAAPDLEINDKGVVWTDGQLATSKPGVFAGGDIATGGATVIMAMAHGRRAAKAIDAYVQGDGHGLEGAQAPWLLESAPPVGID